ncbi:hypothetical protein CBL_21010, partial [Carabus blaptoides fortunei]
MGLKNVLILAYLDDLVVISTSFEEHIADLRQVFKRLQQFGLCANRSKYAFVCSDMSSPLKESNQTLRKFLPFVTIALPTVPAENTWAKQIGDGELKEIIIALETLDNSVDFVKCTNRGYLVNNGILYRYSPECNEEEPQLVVPKSQVKEVLHEYHDSPLVVHYAYSNESPADSIGR